MLAHCRWFSPASSTTKYCRHDIAEILLKVTLNTKNQSINQSIEFQQNADAPEGLESTVSSMFSFCANFWCIKSHFLIKCHAVYNGTSKALTHNTEKYCSEWMYILFYKSPISQNGLKCCLLYFLQLYYVHIDNDVNILMICKGVKLYNNWVKVKESKLQKVVIANSKKTRDDRV